MKNWTVILLVAGLAFSATGHCAPEKVQATLRPAEEEGFGENKLEVSVAAGPSFDVGGNSSEDLLSSTFLSLHWQLDDVGNEGWRRGNTEWVTSAYFHPVWDGTESRFMGSVFGPRYNFVQEGWKFVPYLGAKVGFGFTDSRDNSNLPGAQGQDFVFTFVVETGVRYIVNDTIDLCFGAVYQHFSNAGLSEPAQLNYGLDILGPSVSVNYKF